MSFVRVGGVDLLYTKLGLAVSAQAGQLSSRTFYHVRAQWKVHDFNCPSFVCMEAAEGLQSPSPQLLSWACGPQPKGQWACWVRSPIGKRSQVSGSGYSVGARHLGPWQEIEAKGHFHQRVMTAP